MDIKKKILLRRRRLRMGNKCIQCENKSDFWFFFTGYKLCGKCAYLYLKANTKEKNNA
jgi:hypothetical protein